MCVLLSKPSQQSIIYIELLLVNASFRLTTCSCKEGCANGLRPDGRNICDLSMDSTRKTLLNVECHSGLSSLPPARKKQDGVRSRRWPIVLRRGGTGPDSSTNLAFSSEFCCEICDGGIGRGCWAFLRTFWQKRCCPLPVLWKQGKPAKSAARFYNCWK